MYDFVPESRRPKARSRRYTGIPCRKYDDITGELKTVPHCSLENGNECLNGDCAPEDMNFKCKPERARPGEACTYVLTNCVDENGGQKLRCMFHLTSGNQECRPCCKGLSCGGTKNCLDAFWFIASFDLVHLHVYINYYAPAWEPQ